MRRLLPVVLCSALLVAGCTDPRAPGEDGADGAPFAGPTPFGCAAASFRPGDVNVTFDTSAGSITAVLYGAQSPETVCNFLRYVEDDYYDGTVWHRICAGFVIQMGGLDELGNSEPARDPIRNEAPESQLRNWKGTLAMARTAEPDSATTHLFVNLVDNLRLDFDGAYAPGYAVFGNVTGGWDVVEDIADTPVASTPRAPPELAPLGLPLGGCEGKPLPTMETTIRDILVEA
jgi:cyclophilin family peptidyl-prolyl cis-trans isomerase